MKETNSEVICAEIKAQLSETEYDVKEILGEEVTILAVMNIYLMNDVCKGFGQDFPESRLSIIASKDRISIIYGYQMSFFKLGEQICLYESLSDDIAEILALIQTVFDRIYDQG